MCDNQFIHLCQPDEDKSCGACCGLYNYAVSTKDSLSRRLRERTNVFRETVKCQNDLPAFSQTVKLSEDTRKLYDVIYCCEYLGFLDDGERKVGCLLHPCQNGGEDLREISFYGRELCHGHVCPSYHYLSWEEKLALINITDDWYLYGLCVTDIDLVKSYFRLISERICEVPRPARLKEGDLRDTALNFFSFKISWPFRSEAANRFGKYYFDGSEYMINRIDYGALGCEGSRFNSIFLSLASEFRNGDELMKGERLIESSIEEFVRAYRQ
ncbi:MAG TPA: hypothetical protein VLZ07_11555 [Syntrophales bacterium]|nr:hypothetical protein [Syntrophales bacterium]